MYKLFIILFLSYFYHGFLQAEVVKKIEISGNKRVSIETIQKYGDININKDYAKLFFNDSNRFVRLKAKQISF